MRIKGDPRYGTGYSIALWTMERDDNIREDHARQVLMEIASLIMAYDMTEMWRDAMKSMCWSVGDRVSQGEGRRCINLHCCSAFWTVTYKETLTTIC